MLKTVFPLALVSSLLCLAAPAQSAIISNDFSTDPNWTGYGNTTGGNNYGYQAGTQNVGGVFARTPFSNYYGDTANFGGTSMSLDEAFSFSMTFSIGSVTNFNNGVLLGYFSETLGDFNSFGLLLADHSPTTVRVYADVSYSLTDVARSGALILNSNTTNTVVLTYNPTGGDGFGRLLAVFNGDSDTALAVDLSELNRLTPIVLDGFGMSQNVQPEDLFSGNFFMDNVTYAAPIPEPSSLLLLGVAVVGGMTLRRKLTRNSQVIS